MMQTALIIGASRGIGAEMVRAFCKAGYQVGFTYCRSVQEAKSLETETGARAFFCDGRLEESIIALEKEAKGYFRRLDALIYNAGVAYSGLIQDMTAQEWDDLFSLNVRGAFLATKYFLPAMISRQSGSILYISSMWGQVGASCEAAYSASKAALIGFTKAMAQETGPSHVRVNCIAPGVIETDMLKCYSQEDLQALADETPLQRLGSPVDVAQAAVFLSGQNASFITGQVLGVNGGFVV
ncbi:MAG: SDR family oxidoreductase [Clostridia bacterium]|nr:SDR family oxidoreductase [Clostridiales bacterium]MBQ2976156.1 SDR family oxidoreductase [Clostridia bacterium]MBQ6803557.1 SDR family oxidoreductase [Clostridia bacterium]